MDREKVIKGFAEIIDQEHEGWLTIPQYGIVRDALALLKEQEAVKPEIDAFGHPCCPKCKILVYETWEFCPHCGQAVKWNETDRCRQTQV